MIEENGTAPAPQQQFSLGVQVTPEGVALSFPVTLGLDNETMKQLIKAYLAAHPELLQEIAKESVEAKRRELRLIENIKKSRND